MKKIQMVDLKGQYKKIKKEVDQALIECIESAEFINGKLVSKLVAVCDANEVSVQI